MGKIIEEKQISSGFYLTEENFNKLTKISEKNGMSKRAVIEALLSSVKDVHFNIVFIREEN